MTIISVLYGSYREGRQGIKAARFLVKKLLERGHTVHLVDAAAYDLPMLRKRYGDYEEPPKDLRIIHDMLEESDGFIIVSGEYNHSVPPGLKNLIDHFKPEYKFKPAGIATYSGGQFGGMRVAPHLRAIVGELGMVSIPTMFPVTAVQDFADDGTPPEDSYERRVTRFLDELEWYVDALRLARKGRLPY